MDENSQYFRISPFVYVDSFGDDIYIFNKISEKLLGKIHYNRIIKTVTKDVEWKEFATFNVSSDGIKEKSSNGTIRNIYENNYTTFIDVDIKKHVIDFLENNKSSVCATLWGHGGVGKTLDFGDFNTSVMWSFLKCYLYDILGHILRKNTW